MSDEGLTVSEAAARLDKSERTIRRWCDRGKLDAEKHSTPDGREEWRIEPQSLPGSTDGHDRPGGESVADNRTATDRTRPSTPSPDIQVMAQALRDTMEFVRDQSERDSRKLNPAAQELDRLRSERDQERERVEKLQERIADLREENAALRAKLDMIEAPDSDGRTWWQRLTGRGNNG